MVEEDGAAACKRADRCGRRNENLRPADREGCGPPERAPHVDVRAAGLRHHRGEFRKRKGTAECDRSRQRPRGEFESGRAGLARHDSAFQEHPLSDHVRDHDRNRGAQTQ